MVDRSFLSDRMMDTTIPRLRSRSLETRLGIDGRTVYFDRNGEIIGPIDVVVVWATRMPQQAGGGATSIVTTEGELHGRPDELDQVKAGDLFVIEGQTAEVVEPIVTDAGIVRTPFELMAGGRS